MSLRKALNVLLVAFWVCAQTVMAFSHNASGSSAHVMDQAAKQHMAPNSDCLKHAQTDQEPTGHHSGSGLDQCCGAACSIAGPFTVFELSVDTAARDFVAELVHAPVATNLGLPTPPPNTTF